MESRLSLNTVYAVLLALCLLFETVGRVLYLETSLAVAIFSLVLVSGTAVFCLWYLNHLRKNLPPPQTGPMAPPLPPQLALWPELMGLLCRVVITTQVVLSAKYLIGQESIPGSFRWSYAILCLALTVTTAFAVERDLRTLLPQLRR